MRRVILGKARFTGEGRVRDVVDLLVRDPFSGGGLSPGMTPGGEGKDGEEGGGAHVVEDFLRVE
jgi:hypothetical protein